jgi:hypothetical protein
VAGVLVISEVITTGMFLGVAFIGDSTGIFNPQANNLLLGSILIIPIFFGIGLFLWLGACFAFSVPACALENLGSIAALRRSWKLTTDSRFRLSMLWIMTSIVTWIFSYWVQLAIRRILIYLHWHWHIQFPSQMQYSTFVGAIFAVIYATATPIYSIAITLFYYDQRIRKEGYDIEQMMQTAGWVEEESVVAAAQQVEAPQG